MVVEYHHWFPLMWLVAGGQTGWSSTFWEVQHCHIKRMSYWLGLWVKMDSRFHCSGKYYQKKRESLLCMFLDLVYLKDTNFETLSKFLSVLSNTNEIKVELFWLSSSHFLLSQDCINMFDSAPLLAWSFLPFPPCQLYIPSKQPITNDTCGQCCRNIQLYSYVRFAKKCIMQPTASAPFKSTKSKHCRWGSTWVPQTLPWLFIYCIHCVACILHNY